MKIKTMVAAGTLCVATVCLGANPALTTLRNERLTLALGEAEKGAVVAFTDNATGSEFIAADRAARLFSLAFSKKTEAAGARFYLSSRDAKKFTAHPEREGVRLEYEGLGDWPVRVTCTARAPKNDPLVRWRIVVKVPDTLVLEEVHFPIITLRAPLGASVDDDAAVFGHTKGGVIRRPGAMKTGARVSGRQPGSLAAQFGCYYDDRAGVYLAAHDGRGWPKTFEMRRVATGVEMEWNVPCFASGEFAPDFDFITTTFTSRDSTTPADWHDAADLYKAWALTQPWCATLFEKRADVPAWMKAGPAMVRFSREWLAQPAIIEKWLTEYWKKEFPNAPLVVAFWGWEKVWGWVTPDYFPVFPSDQQFTNLVQRVRALGGHAFPWPSGYHWTLTFRKRADGSFEWDDRKRFDAVARVHAVHDRDGKLYVRQPSWLVGGETACLCPGDPWTINWWNQDICAPLNRRGCEMIQVDQVVGGNFPFCYDRNHPHPPGPGPWMTDVFTRQLRTMFETCRAIEREAVVCFEEPNERFNHLAAIQDYRDCETQHELASVFNYLYHEFLPTFQSNPRAGDLVRDAHCVVSGQMPHLVPHRDFGDAPALVNGGFEEPGVQREQPYGWDQVREYGGQKWTGQGVRDPAEHHSGAASLRLENTAESDVVQISQNVTVGSGALIPGKRYRLSAWMKTARMAKPNGINFGLFAPGLKHRAGGRLPMPAAGSAWTKAQAEFTAPADAEMLRIMIHVTGPAKVWVDDMALEEVRDDGTAAVAMRTRSTTEHALMKRWVELYHGEGRPWLQFGRMLHPPKLTCGSITYQNRPMPAVMHNAFRAADGREAVVLANATAERQTAKLVWKQKEMALDLGVGEILLVQ